MIRLENFGKNYGSVPAVSGVTLTARKGDVTGLLGQNGAGKTTILKAVCAIHYPSAGTVRTGGFLTTEESVKVHMITGYVS